jgi:hypothetical protein
VLNNPSDADSAHGITKAYLVEVSDGRHTVQVQAQADAGVSLGVLRMPMGIDGNRGLPLSEAPLSLRVIASLPEASEVSTAGAA